MATTRLFNEDENQILVEGNSRVKVVTLNRPQKLNAISHQMVLQLLKTFKAFERDPNVNLVIVKGKGRAFSAGGDVTAMISYMAAGHWTFGAQFYKKQLMLDYTVATYKKPQVFFINGVVMGGGAGLSMLGRFRIVTENAVFAMPEAKLGHFPDVGASYFLSRLPGFFGEYIGLTGARLDGAEMLACGLATHCVLSKNLPLLEKALYNVDTKDPTIICSIINQYELRAPLKKDSACRRVDIINKCFSKGTVEEILSTLEHEVVNGADEWITTTIKSIKMGSPTKLKLFLRSIREGRLQGIDECLIREYRMASHVLRRTVCNDFFEGSRAMLFDKDKKPKWEPSKLELVSEDMLDKYFTKVDADEDWEDLQLSCRANPVNSVRAKL